MKRLEVVFSFILFVALCGSAAYWLSQLIKPAARTVSLPPQPPEPELNLAAAATLFGGRASTAVASNYLLKGVLNASNANDSVAILSADGKPAQAYGVGMMLAPGVVVKEVHPKYVMISQGGVFKRVELAESEFSNGSNGLAYIGPPTAETISENNVPPTTVPVPVEVQPAAPPPSEQNPNPEVKTAEIEHILGPKRVRSRAPAQKSVSE